MIPGKSALLGTFAAVLLLVCGAAASDWSDAVRTCVERKDFACAGRLVQEQLQAHPDDVEAMTWRARLLAWNGRWDDAEAGYNAALRLAPNDADILLGLADVQTWKKNFSAALITLDRAAALQAAASEVLPRRAAVLSALGRDSEAAATYEALLKMSPGDSESRNRLRELRQAQGSPAARRHELRIGSDTDTFSYTGAANAESLSLQSRWSGRWSSRFAGTFYQRFGQKAELFHSEVTLHLTESSWLTAGGGAGTRQPIIPEYDYATEFGHAFRVHAGPIHGLETYLQQRNFWYSAAQVSTFGSTQVLYLPRDWMWSGGVTAARTAIPTGAADWTPSGFTRLSIPLSGKLRGNLLYAVGAEDYSFSDQIGRFSAHTYGGGMRIQLTRLQDISVNVAVQLRSQSRSQTSVGVSYGIRF